ncbi:MAG TPA: hypothetical protein VMS77_01100 [Conexivisphaerales archaeon]|nr:hypothetical protein [Conexivisphaerales archaeon]
MKTDGDRLRLSPWDEIVGTLVSADDSSVTLECSRRFRIELDGEELGPSGSLLRVGEPVALLRLEDGSFRVRRPAVSAEE